VKRWSFETKRAQRLKDTLVVDAGGRGDFCTLQGALDFIPDNGKKLTTVLVKAGDYEEIVYTRNKSHVVIIGEGMDKTRIHYANNEVFNPHPMTLKTNEWPGTFPSRRSPVTFDNCSDITLQNLTCATDLKGQAEGLLLHGDRIALYDVRIIGDGDAIQANGTIYMEDCEVIGGGDTFLGRGSVFAHHCKLINHGGPFSWVRNTKGNHGDVFVACSFDTDNGAMADFGRTVTNKGIGYPDAEFVAIDCLLGNIAPEGWGNIGKKTATMLEYNSRSLSDPSKTIDVSKRHQWSRQLTMEKDEELINNYRDPAYVLKGWNPRNIPTHK
jgi:pectin methylesterase-like acyl-CoA thioesterase